MSNEALSIVYSSKGNGFCKVTGCPPLEGKNIRDMILEMAIFDGSFQVNSCSIEEGLQIHYSRLHGLRVEATRVYGPTEFVWTTVFGNMSLSGSSIDKTPTIDALLVTGNLSLEGTRLTRGFHTEYSGKKTPYVEVPHVIGDVRISDRTLVRSEPYKDGLDDWHIGVLKSCSDALKTAVHEARC